MNRITLTLIAVLCGVRAKDLSELEVLSSTPTRCTYERAYDMYGAYCAGLKLNKLPNLKSGIEILDLTDNKLREIKADTFASYTSIKFLYLADNAIYHVEENSFSGLTYLQTLDLSMNVVQTLTVTIFNLPSLRNLYLSGNPLTKLAADVKNLQKPIKAPLEQLDLSNCGLFTLPDLGILPQLRLYNISHNPLTSLETHHFAHTCNLKKVDLSESIEKVRHCDLRPTVTWFEEKHIYFILEDYVKLNSKEFENCKRENISTSLNVTHQNCKAEYLQVQSVRGSPSKWLTIGGALAGFLVAFILLLYVVHRRNVAQTTKAIKKENTHRGNEKSSADALLNAPT